MSTTIFLSLFPPFRPLTLSLPSSAPLSDIRHHLPREISHIPLTLSTPSSALLDLSDDNLILSSLHPHDAPLVSLRLIPALRGGKGGFGSQLRAAGGRMSSQKTSNNDSCRDLSGRRLSTVKEANKLAEYLAAEPARKKAAAEAQKAKLEALERKLGIDTQASTSKPQDNEPEILAGKKHRFDDTEYLEQSRELVEGVKSAVSLALLKKKKNKKAKTSHPETPDDSVKGKVESSSEAPALPTIVPVIAQDVGVGA